MSKYRGLFTFDTDNHKYVTIASADGIMDLESKRHYSYYELVGKEQQ